MSVSLLSVTEPFKIFVGDASINKMYYGYPENGMATLKSGTQLGEMEYTGGTNAFPNYWEAWGRRVINGKPLADGTSIEVTHKDYIGEIEFLANTDAKGSPIFCRYIRGQQSLDYQYQITRLGLIKKEQDEENLMIMLDRGEHKIVPQKDMAYALTMKVHPMNENSVFRAAKIGNSIYKEVEVFEINKSEVKFMDDDFEAGKIVRECSKNFATLKTLHTVLTSEKEIEYDKSDEGSLYIALLFFAKNEPANVLRLVAKYKEKVSALIDRFKSYKAFDTTKNGTIGYGVNTKQLLIDGIKGSKGEDMLQDIYERCLEPEMFEAINKLYDYASKNFK